MEEDIKEIIKGFEAYRKEQKKDWIDRAENQYRMILMQEEIKRGGLYKYE